MDGNKAKVSSPDYSTAACRLAQQAAALRVILAAHRLQQLLLKANFNPDEPRIPRGSSGGGRWTAIGGAVFGPSAAHPHPRVIRVGDDEPRIFRIKPGILEEEFTGSPNFPDIPEDRPVSASDRYRVLKMLPMAPGAVRPGRSLPDILQAIDAPDWLREYYPWMHAYAAAPKPLAELKAGALTSRPGYDVHHIVEKGPALEDGFPRSLVNGPDNLVSISRLKHWEITGWSQTGNEEFGGLSPRSYLRGKTWIERQELGIWALEEFGILRP